MEDSKPYDQLTFKELVTAISDINLSLEYYESGQTNLIDRRKEKGVEEFIEEFSDQHKKIIKDTISNHFKTKYSTVIEDLNTKRAELFKILKTKNP